MQVWLASRASVSREPYKCLSRAVQVSCKRGTKVALAYCWRGECTTHNSAAQHRLYGSAHKQVNDESQPQRMIAQYRPKPVVQGLSLIHISEPTRRS